MSQLLLAGIVDSEYNELLKRVVKFQSFNVNEVVKNFISYK